jgi:predicted ATP-grasp superfamily ATP-dependent carboligase
LVIPLIDPSLATCSDHREDLPEGVKLAAPSAAAVRNVLDKRENLETARRLGIRCPGEFTLEDVDQLQELIEKLGFPMVLKNTGLARGESHPAHAFKWRIARDERELRALLAELVGNGRYPLFQELVDGQITNLCCFAVSGKVVAVHEYRSLRRLGWAGNGVLREIAAPTPGLIDQAERLLGDLQWEGAAHVGFVVRRSDGASWYMETNGRFWGSIEGSIAIGWDFPYWTYRYFTHGDLPAPPSLEIGSRACWHFGDLNLLWKRLQGTEPPVPPGPPRLHAIAEYLAGFAPGVHSDVFALDDPLPSLVEHWEWIGPALARGLHRLR